MTHPELVERAAAWLRSYHKCIVVLTEHTGSRECPDAIGWNRRLRTILVECKRSKGDLYADFQKPWRREADLEPGYWLAHGRERWYLLDSSAFTGATPPALNEPARRHWGIASVSPARVRILRPAIADDAWTQDRDAVFLVRELQRFQVQGMKPRTWAEHQSRIHPSWQDIHEARQLMGLEPVRPPGVELPMTVARIDVDA